MSSRDGKFEFVRVRSKRDKEKSVDIRSVGSSKRHRNSGSASGSHGAPTETASQISSSTYQDLPLEQLPPLPEESTNGDSTTSNSPLLRTTSHSSNSNSHISLNIIHTPATLRPYLEIEGDSTGTVTAQPSTVDLREWIGPDSDSIRSQSLHTDTPRASKKSCASDTASVVSFQDNTAESVKSAADMHQSADEGYQKGKESDSSPLQYSWSSVGSANEQFYLPSQLPNPFLPMPASNGQPLSPQPMVSQIIPQHSNYGPPPPQSSSPNASKEPPPQATSPAMSNSNPHGYGYGVMSPGPNTIPCSSSYRTVDSPAYLLQRIGSAIPDICALVDLYQNTCGILRSRDNQISDMESQQAMESRKLNSRIENLQKDIESVLSKKSAEIAHLKEEVSNMRDDWEVEMKLKEEARAAAGAVQKALEHAEMEHREEKHAMTCTFADEKGKMVADFATKEKNLKEQIQAEARVAEATLSARVAEMNRQHESDKQALEDRWIQHKREVEDNHARARRELENSLVLKQKVLDEERLNYVRAKEGWDRERDSMTRRWEEERALLRKASEDQRNSLLLKHQREKDDMQSAVDAALSQQRSEAQEVISLLQGERDDLGQTLEIFQARHKSEIQNITAQMQREKDDFRKGFELAQSRQRSEFQDTLTKLQREDQEMLDKLQRENQDLRGAREQSRSRESVQARETIGKLQRDVEQLKSGWNADKLKLQKYATEPVVPSRPTTPAAEKSRTQRLLDTQTSPVNPRAKAVAFEQGRIDDGLKPLQKANTDTIPSRPVTPSDKGRMHRMSDSQTNMVHPKAKLFEQSRINEGSKSTQKPNADTVPSRPVTPSEKGRMHRLSDSQSNAANLRARAVTFEQGRMDDAPRSVPRSSVDTIPSRPVTPSEKGRAQKLPDTQSTAGTSKSKALASEQSKSEDASKPVPKTNSDMIPSRPTTPSEKNRTPRIADNQGSAVNPRYKPATFELGKGAMNIAELPTQRNEARNNNTANSGKTIETGTTAAPPRYELEAPHEFIRSESSSAYSPSRR